MNRNEIEVVLYNVKDDSVLAKFIAGGIFHSANDHYKFADCKINPFDYEKLQEEKGKFLKISVLGDTFCCRVDSVGLAVSYGKDSVIGLPDITVKKANSDEYGHDANNKLATNAKGELIMNNVEFAKGTIVTVLNKLEVARQKENNKVYKTLSDSLNEAIGIIRRQSKINDINPFLVLLKDEIEKETAKLTNIANKAIENDNFKEHHDWIIAFRKLDSIRENLGYDVKKEGLRNTLPQYKSYNVYDIKGLHLVISHTEHQAIQCVYEKFKLDDKEVNVSRSGKTKIFNNDRVILTYGLSDTVRGRRGEVLHIDKSIGLRGYVDLVDSLVSRFTVVNLLD